MGAGRGGRGGTVVQTSSVAGVLAGALGAARHGHVEHVYTAAKSGLIGLTRCDKLSPVSTSPQVGSLVHMLSQVVLLAKILETSISIRQKYSLEIDILHYVVRGLGNARCTAWAEDRVRVMAVCPGGVDTDMIKEFLKVRIMIV